MGLKPGASRQGVQWRLMPNFAAREVSYINLSPYTRACEFCLLAIWGRVMFADASGHTETELTLQWVIAAARAANRRKYGNAILSRSTHASGNYKERAIRVLTADLLRSAN